MLSASRTLPGVSSRPSARRPAAIVRASTTASSTSRPDYSVSLFDALKFNSAPETINGRLAMVGFVNCVFHEVTYSEGILKQVQDLDAPTIALLAMWVVASLAPVLKGVRNNEAFGPFSPQAEIVNGRAAMLGIVALAFLEYKAGVPFF